MLWKAENVLLFRHLRRGNRPSEPHSLVDVWDAVLTSVEALMKLNEIKKLLNR